MITPVPGSKTRPLFSSLGLPQLEHAVHGWVDDAVRHSEEKDPVHPLGVVPLWTREAFSIIFSLAERAPGVSKTDTL